MSRQRVRAQARRGGGKGRGGWLAAAWRCTRVYWERTSPTHCTQGVSHEISPVMWTQCNTCHCPMSLPKQHVQVLPLRHARGGARGGAGGIARGGTRGGAEGGTAPAAWRQILQRGWAAPEGEGHAAWAHPAGAGGKHGGQPASAPRKECGCGWQAEREEPASWGWAAMERNKAGEQAGSQPAV